MFIGPASLDARSQKRKFVVEERKASLEGVGQCVYVRRRHAAVATAQHGALLREIVQVPCEEINISSHFYLQAISWQRVHPPGHRSIIIIKDHVNKLLFLIILLGVTNRSPVDLATRFRQENRVLDDVACQIVKQHQIEVMVEE